MHSFSNSDTPFFRPSTPKLSPTPRTRKLLPPATPPAEPLTTERKKFIEDKWKNEVLSVEASHKPSGGTKYVLSMFPYPSGALHMGHVRVYTLSDVIARYYRLKGCEVIHPMGWDAFGLPAENAAIEHQQEPKKWTYSNIAQMKNELLRLGYSFDWHREFATCDPSYYKWTQYLFILMMENGFAFQANEFVNWDPVDQTVLADEQVDENGIAWRSGAKIEKKLLRQWFIETTKLAPEMIAGLKREDLQDWFEVQGIQKHFLGQADSFAVHFPLLNTKTNEVIVDSKLRCISSCPEFISVASFIAISSTHPLASMVDSLMALNPLDPDGIPPIPIIRLPLDLLPLNEEDGFFPKGTQAYVGFGGYRKQDRQIIEQIGLLKRTGHTWISGLEIDNPFQLTQLRDDVCRQLQEKRLGGYLTSSKLKSWLVSRQRYWGTPIPVIHCTDCGAVPVRKEDLPVRLPEGVTSLAAAPKEWLEAKCPKCGKLGHRETDTLDTFFDSSWYFLRFLDPQNQHSPFDAAVVDDEMPVSVYIGGKEHACLHLYYARFMQQFLYHLSLSKHSEPFSKLCVVGQVMAETHKTSDGKYLKKEEMTNKNGVRVEAATEQPVVTTWEKMSKSRYNGVQPGTMLDEYGVDSVRLFMVFDAVPRSERKFSLDTMQGLINWQRRVSLTVDDFIASRMKDAGEDGKSKLNLPLGVNFEDDIYGAMEKKLWELRNKFVEYVSIEIGITYRISMAIRKMISYTKDLRQCPQGFIAQSKNYEKALADLLITASPIIPHLASELWERMSSVGSKDIPGINWSAPVLRQSWPEVDMDYVLPLLICLNGSKKPEVVLRFPRHKLDQLTEAEVFEMVMSDERLSQQLLGHTILEKKFVRQPGISAQFQFMPRPSSSSSGHSGGYVSTSSRGGGGASARLKFRGDFYPSASHHGERPLPDPAPVSQILIMVVIHLCKKVLLLDFYAKVAAYLACLFLLGIVADTINLPKTYLAYSKNVLNQVFTSFGWGWTLMLSGAFITTTSLVHSCGNWRKVIGLHLSRLAIGTFIWWSCTSLMSHLERSTGVCNLTKQSTKEMCRDKGGIWKSFDISGHAFLLIYCNLVMMQEAVAILGWEGLKDTFSREEFARKAAASGGPDGGEETALRDLPEKEFQAARDYYHKVTPWVKVGVPTSFFQTLFILMTLLSMLYDVLLAGTILYFHIMTEKLIGGLLAIVLWFVTYRMWFASKSVWPSYPGRGDFVYYNPALKLSSESSATARRRASLRRNTREIETSGVRSTTFMGMPYSSSASPNSNNTGSPTTIVL
ncbi:unnamed protein product [Cyprideis torosa]|uniref:leucine--tRNA ligase n=1 Tax=Cyprideis torosa TaxID=163714 RepID=A0A7R8ZRG4_9CRUS|nr:unnamed protein product [Cyprideis torosa]CAG0894173.1 unnamed protein product [Cyprideis torosa]